MRLCIAFPNVGQPHDSHILKDYAQALESLGVDSLNVVDHIVYAWPGADGQPRSRYRGDLWHLEAFSTLGFLAGVTSRITLDAGVIVLPQRPPALVAKEASTVDYLSDGRLRLGVAVGWQDPEYEALGVPFRQRGARMEEALDVLIMLFTQAHVTFHGRYYHLEDVGMEPKSIQKPHPPLIVGGHHPRALLRAGRVGNGWAAGTRATPSQFGPLKEQVVAAACAAGRAADVTIFKGCMLPRSPDPADTIEDLREYRRLGATDIQYWMGTANHAELHSLEAKLKYTERLVNDVWPVI